MKPTTNQVSHVAPLSPTLPPAPLSPIELHLTPLSPPPFPIFSSHLLSHSPILQQLSYSLSSAMDRYTLPNQVDRNRALVRPSVD